MSVFSSLGVLRVKLGVGMVRKSGVSLRFLATTRETGVRVRGKGGVGTGAILM